MTNARVMLAHVAPLPRHPGARRSSTSTSQNTEHRLERGGEGDREAGRRSPASSSARVALLGYCVYQVSCRASRAAAPRRRSSASTRRFASCTPPRCCTSFPAFAQQSASKARRGQRRRPNPQRVHQEHVARTIAAALAPQGARRARAAARERAPCSARSTRRAIARARGRGGGARRGPAQPHVPQLPQGGADDGGRHRAQWPSSPTRWST
jgi:hypothetical protein